MLESNHQFFRPMRHPRLSTSGGVKMHLIRRIELRSVENVTVSPFADNFVVLHVKQQPLKEPDVSNWKQVGTTFHDLFHHLSENKGVINTKFGE